jgi:predicted ATP-grasp superfamily ATP-dependent carboligase
VSTLPTALVFPDNLGALAAARELGAAGIPVVVAGPKRGPAARSRFATYLEMPDLYQDTSRWAEALCTWGAAQKTTPVLFASEDAGLLAAEKHHDLLATSFLKPHPAPGVILGVVDKRRLYAAAERVGVAVPGSREITDATEVEGLKASGWLVKPAVRYRLHDNGGIYTFLQATGATKAIGGEPAKAAREVLAAGFPTILQEAVPGPFENLVTLAVSLSRDGKVLDHFAACKQYEYPEPFGDGLIVRTIRDPGLLEPCVRLLRELGYWGICDIEFKRDIRDGVYKLLDANPRTWLWLNLGTRSGHRLLLAAYGQATGLDLRPSAGGSAGQREWVSPRGTMAFLTRCYRPRRHGLALPPRLMIGAVSTMMGNWWAFRDPLYLRPSAWPELVRASSRLLRRR